MRITLAAALLSATLATAASAQDKVWTAAPVPGNTPTGYAPADRAGTSTSTDTGSPFSAQPSGLSTSRPTTSSQRDGSSPGTDGLTPNLSR